MKRYTPAEYARFAKRAARTSALDAACYFNVSNTTIRLAMKHAGIKPRRAGNQGKYSYGQKARAVELVVAGKTPAEVERETKIPAKYARQLWRVAK